VATGDERVEVVGNLDVDVLLGGDLLDHVRLDAVGVVQLDEFVDRDGLSRLGVLVGQLPDAAAAPVQRLAVLLDLGPDDVADVVAVLVAQPLGLHVDEFVQRRVDADGVTEPFRPPEDHPGEVARADVGGDDFVTQHVRQRPAVVGDGVDVLQRLHQVEQLLRSRHLPGRR